MRSLIALLLTLWLAPAWAQVPMTGAGKGTPAVAASYQGPGDVFSTSPLVWYSCSRVFNAAGASTSTNLCDLVDSTAPTTVICTLRGTSSGFVDLAGTYCTGSLTPADKCAAATGAVCNISKVYNQVSPGTADMVQTTAVNQPTLTFSSTPSTTLPAINCGTGGVLFMASSSTVTQAQPLTFSFVHIRSTGTAIGGTIGDSAGSAAFSGAGTGANLAHVAATTSLTKAASDAAWHAVNAMANGTGTSSAINVDGSDSTGSAGTGGYSGRTLRLCRAGSQLLGSIAEAGIWGASTTSTNRNNLNTNQHSAANGYNF